MTYKLLEIPRRGSPGATPQDGTSVVVVSFAVSFIRPYQPPKVPRWGASSSSMQDLASSGKSPSHLSFLSATAIFGLMVRSYSSTHLRQINKYVAQHNLLTVRILAVPGSFEDNFQSR
ncbi:hypothetical protein ANO14919_003990 [Xylariales sp. No.14919]|nr:hypothetical protein ANO14919_003990 [Xylariales sp. No.14919]